MILPIPSSAHVLLHHHLRPVPAPRGPGHRRRLLSAAQAAARRDDATTEASTSSSSSSSESLRTTAAPTKKELTPAAGLPLSKDCSHTLFHSECLEVLGLVDLESRRKRPRITVGTGVTIKASVVLPVLVVLAVLYLADMAKGVVDWTHHLEPGEDVGD